MVSWRSRHFGYKLGFFGLIVSTIVYVIAYAIPYWAVLYLRQYGMVDQTVGLWQACALRSSTCVSNVHGSNPSWLNAARATCSLALVLLAVALFCGYYRNFSRLGQERCQSPGRHVEGLAMMACLLGLSGAIIFAYQFMEDYVHVRHSGSDRELNLGRLHWAYPLLCSALGLVGISACLMLLFNRRRYHHADSPSPRRLRGGGPLVPMTVQFWACGGGEDDRVHVPYLGEVWRTQLVPGASPLQPPSYELATGGTAGTYDVGYAAPPGDISDAPPLYKDVAAAGKDGVLPSPASQVFGSGQSDGDGDDKAAGEEDGPDRRQNGPPPPPLV